MCVVFKVIKASIDLFCTRHVCIQKHTHVYAHGRNWSDNP